MLWHCMSLSKRWIRWSLWMGAVIKAKGGPMKFMSLCLFLWPGRVYRGCKSSHWSSCQFSQFSLFPFPLVTMLYEYFLCFGLKYRFWSPQTCQEMSQGLIYRVVSRLQMFKPWGPMSEILSGFTNFKTKTQNTVGRRGFIRSIQYCPPLDL